MNKFFLNLFFVLSISITIWSMIYSNIAMRIHIGDIARWKFKLDKINNSRKQFETVILGDSAADSGLRSKFLNHNTINLSLGAGSTVDGYYYFVNYLKNHSPPKRLVLCYSGLGMVTRPTFYDHTLTFKFFDLIEMIKADLTGNDVYEILKPPFDIPITQTKVTKIDILKKFLVYWELLALKASLDIHQLKKVENIFINNIYMTNLRRYNKLYKFPDNYIEFPYKANEIKSNIIPKKFVINQTFKYFTKKIINLASDLGVRVYIITPPVNEIYIEDFSLQLMKSLFDEYYSFTSKMNDVKVYPNILIYKKENFDDSLHLNEVGAMTFTKITNDFLLK